MTLKAIHGKLYECCVMAKKQLEYIEKPLVPTAGGFYKMYNLLGKVNGILKDAMARGVITEGIHNAVKKISALTEELNRQGGTLDEKKSAP